MSEINNCCLQYSEFFFLYIDVWLFVLCHYVMYTYLCVQRDVLLWWVCLCYRTRQQPSEWHQTVCEPGPFANNATVTHHTENTVRHYNRISLCILVAVGLVALLVVVLLKTKVCGFVWKIAASRFIRHVPDIVVYMRYVETAVNAYENISHWYKCGPVCSAEWRLAS